MKRFLVNLALIGSVIGFIAYLFIIIAGFFGCCAGITTFLFHKIVLGIVVISAIILGLCMYNNCCKTLRKVK